MTDRHRTRGAQTTVTFFLVILIIIGFITRWIDISFITGPLQKKLGQPDAPLIYTTEIDCSLNCSEISPETKGPTNPSAEECPEYFRWIHEDLKPWKETGITREMVEKARSSAHIRIVIVNGRLYTEKYKDAFQTRDPVTIWGILQLLRLYPGMIPDLDLMFECDDKPVIKKRDYGSPNASVPPPMFHYCGNDATYDIVFPDWSFWGWPEVNIKPWNILKEDLKEGNSRMKWMDREPYAYWKGNSKLGAARRDLLKCNASDNQDFKGRLFNMDWHQEKEQGFNNSDLASQCTYRYKIYVEGISWSVSEKYILACDSMSLIVKPKYYDFFTRSLLPTIHYWPIDGEDKCRSVNVAVEQGNKDTNKAQEIGKAGSSFVQENLEMKYVYDYMFHLLNEYAKLLKYQPTIPEGAVEMCSEALFCSVKGRKRRFTKQSMVRSPADSLPCTLPPHYEPAELRSLLEENENLTKKVLLLEESKSTEIQRNESQ